MQENQTVNNIYPKLNQNYDQYSKINLYIFLGLHYFLFFLLLIQMHWIVHQLNFSKILVKFELIDKLQYNYYNTDQILFNELVVGF